MKRSVEKSEQQADVIKFIALAIENFDIEYCQQAAKDMIEQANTQDSMIILNPNHPLIANSILRKKGEALNLLCRYAKTINEIQSMNKELAQEEQSRDAISKLFMK